MSYEDKVSSSNYVRDKVSLSKSPFMYHEFPERIRMGYDNVMLPFVWSDRDKVRWCHDEWFCERAVELFTLRE